MALGGRKVCFSQISSLHIDHCLLTFSSCHSLSVPEVVISTASSSATSTTVSNPPSNTAQVQSQSSAQPSISAPSHPSAQGVSPISVGQMSNLTRAPSTTSLSSLPNGITFPPTGLPGPGLPSTLGLMDKAGTLGGISGGLGWNPSLGRDPRGRAKSREYLKQCLQEITYLTSAAALNPLPEKTPAGVSRPRKEIHDIGVPHAGTEQNHSSQILGQPFNTAAATTAGATNMDGNTVIPLNPSANPVAPFAESAMADSGVTHSVIESYNVLNSITTKGPAPEASHVTPLQSYKKAAAEQANAAESNFIMTDDATPASSSMPNGDSVSQTSQSYGDTLSSSQTSPIADEEISPSDAANRLTAIFRPDSGEEWKKALKTAGDEAGFSGAINEEGSVTPAGVPMSEGTREVVSDYSKGRSSMISSSSSAASSEYDHKVWKPRRTLRA